MKPRMIALTLLVMAGAIALIITRLLSAPDRVSPEAPQTRVVDVKRGDIRDLVAETGIVEPARVVEIKSEQPGEVKAIFVGAGDGVRRGQRLATIQQESAQARQVAQLRADIEQENRKVSEAKRNLERKMRLFEKGFIAQIEVEEEEDKYKESVTRLELAKRQLLLALGGDQDTFERQLKRPLASGELEEFIIASPLTGTVMSVQVATGEKVMSGTTGFGGGTTVMTIADLEHLIVRSKVNEVNIGQVRPGQPVEIRFDAIAAKTYRGSVLRIAPQGERDNNVVTYDVLIEIANSEGRIRPMMTAKIDIITSVVKNALFVPVEALLRKGGEDTVYVEQNGQRVARKVKVGARTGTYAEIHEGLREGEMVILSPGE